VRSPEPSDAMRCDAQSLCGLVGHSRACNARGYVPTELSVTVATNGAGSVECALDVRLDKAWPSALERPNS